MDKIQNFNPRSHRQRVKDAKNFCAETGLSLDIFDREAIVEYFLIEDLNVLVAQNLEIAVERLDIATDKMSKGLATQLVEGYTKLSSVLSSLVNFFGLLVEVGQYDIVRKSIPESLLQRSVTRIKDSNKLTRATKLALEALDTGIMFAINNGVIEKQTVDEAEKKLLHSKHIELVKGIKPKSQPNVIEVSDDNTQKDEEATKEAAKKAISDAQKAMNRKNSSLN